MGLAGSLTHLAEDDWWEVRAQLLLLCARLLERSAALTDAGEAPSEEGVERLLGIAQRCLQPQHSKNLVQVGLTALAPVLAAYPALLPAYVQCLMAQPAALRQRLFEPAPDGVPRRLAYVMGTSSRLYEEFPVSEVWPGPLVISCFADHVEAQVEAGLSHFEAEHFEVILQCLPKEDFEEESEATEVWLSIFERVKDFVFVALVDPDLFAPAMDVVRKFWLSQNAAAARRCIEVSEATLLQTLRLLYSPDLERSRVDEDTFIEFLMEFKEAGGEVKLALQRTVDSFRLDHNEQYEASSLGRYFDT